MKIGNKYKNNGVIRDIVEGIDGRYILLCEKDGEQKWVIEGDEKS